MKTDGITFIGVLAAFSCFFYLKGIEVVGLLQPTLFLTIVIFLLHLAKGDLIFNRILGLSALVNFIHLVVQNNTTGNVYGLLNEMGRLVFPLMLSAVAIVYLHRTTNIKIFFQIGIIFLLIDTFARMIENKTFIPLESRYDIKGGGLIYADSNFTSFLAGALFLLAVKFRQSKLVRFLYFFVFLYGFSLGAYFGMMVAYFYYFYKKTARVSILVRCASFTIIVISFIFMMNYLYTEFSDDGSFITKIEIAEALLNFANLNPMYIFTGVGYGNFREFTNGSHAAHSSLGLIVEGGLIFILFNLILYFTSWRDEPNRISILYIIVSSLSMMPIAYMAPVYILLFLKINSEKQC